jgi:hypothetical protein
MPKAPTYFQERKDFIKRMISPDVKVIYAREQKIAKDIFSTYPVDFLNVVRKPFDMNSLAWFISPDGKEYLEKNAKIFSYKPKQDKVVEGTEKQGYNYTKKINKGFREFLNE